MKKKNKKKIEKGLEKGIINFGVTVLHSYTILIWHFFTNMIAKDAFEFRNLKCGV